MGLSVLTATTYSAVVPTTDLRAHVRGSTSDDVELVNMSAAAADLAEKMLGRTLLHSTLRFSRDVWPAGPLELPRQLTSASSTNVTVSYRAEGGSTYTTFPSTNYIVDAESEPGRVVLKRGVNWPDTALESANAVRVDFVSGYTGSTDVPQSVRHAIRFLGGHWFENRESVVVGAISKEIEQAVKALLWANRIPHVP
jgi:uncharacterized phiE125 gp8 family phage protein